MVKPKSESSPTKKDGATCGKMVPDSLSTRLLSPSPRKRAAALFDNYVTVASRGSPHKKTALESMSPHKASLSQRSEMPMSPSRRSTTPMSPLRKSAVLSSPGKRSPFKRILDLSEQSPRKRVPVDITSDKLSPLKRSHKADSPCKAVPELELAFNQAKQMTQKVASPQKRQTLNVKSPVKTADVGVRSAAGFDPVAETQRLLRQRISQMNCPPFICGYEKERKQLHGLIQRTAMMGESNSLLLIGPRGCGKSMLIRDVVEDLFKDKKIKEDMMLVQLNGLLQSDDRIALREITRQLQLENTVGDRVFGSFAETLQFLLEALKKGDQGSKPTLFVLEEFDLFAQHKNQTLLYNLFDISQSTQAPICVVGVTCRLDVVELLEKRVKSRFSHRQIHLFNNLSLAQYRELCLNYLSLPDNFQDSHFSDQWNKNVKELLDEVAVKDVLERQFNLMNDVRGLLSLLTYPVCKISAAHPTIKAADLITSFRLISTDTKSSMLHGVSILELAIIIAMKHLTDIYEGEPFNFEMVYSEYLKFARHRTGMQIYEKPIVMKAYEHLQTLELIRGQGHATASGIGVGGGQKEYRLMTLLVHPSQIMDALQKYPNCPTEIKQWASQSIS